MTRDELKKIVRDHVLEVSTQFRVKTGEGMTDLQINHVARQAFDTILKVDQLTDVAMKTRRDELFNIYQIV